MVEPLHLYCSTDLIQDAIADTEEIVSGLDARLGQLRQQAQAAAAAQAAAGQHSHLQGAPGSGGPSMQVQQGAPLARVRSGTAQMEQLQELQQQQMRMMQQQEQQQQAMMMQQRQASMGLMPQQYQQQQQQYHQAAGFKMPPSSPDAELLESLLNETQSTPAALQRGNNSMLQQLQQQGHNMLNRPSSADVNAAGGMGVPWQQQQQQQQVASKRKQQQQGQKPSKQAKQEQETAAAALAEAEDDYDPPGGVEGMPNMTVAVDSCVKSAAMKIRNCILVRCGGDKPYYLDEVSGMSQHLTRPVFSCS